MEVHLWGALRPFAENLNDDFNTLRYEGVDAKKGIVNYLSLKNENKMKTL